MMCSLQYLFSVKVRWSSAFMAEQRSRRCFTSSLEAFEIVGPVVELAATQPLAGPVIAELAHHLPTRLHVVLRPSADEGEGRRTERELEEAAAERRDIVVMPLRRSFGDNIGLAVSQTKTSIKFATRGVLCFGVGQIELGRAGFQNDVAMRREIG